MPNTAPNDERTVEGFITIEERDAQGDLVPVDELAKAFPRFMARGGLLMERHSNKPIGHVREYQITKNEQGKRGIKIKAALHKDMAIDDAAWAKVKEKKYTGFSIGGLSKSNALKCDPATGDCYNQCGDIDLWEISLVGEPANKGARVTAFNEFAKMLRKEDSGLVVIMDTQELVKGQVGMKETGVIQTNSGASRNPQGGGQSRPSSLKGENTLDMQKNPNMGTVGQFINSQPSGGSMEQVVPQVAGSMNIQPGMGTSVGDPTEGKAHSKVQSEAGMYIPTKTLVAGGSVPAGGAPGARPSPGRGVVGDVLQKGPNMGIMDKGVEVHAHAQSGAGGVYLPMDVVRDFRAALGAIQSTTESHVGQAPSQSGLMGEQGLYGPKVAQIPDGPGNMKGASLGGSAQKGPHMMPISKQAPNVNLTINMADGSGAAPMQKGFMSTTEDQYPGTSYDQMGGHQQPRLIMLLERLGQQLDAFMSGKGRMGDEDSTSSPVSSGSMSKPSMPGMGSDSSGSSSAPDSSKSDASGSSKEMSGVEESASQSPPSMKKEALPEHAPNPGSAGAKGIEMPLEQEKKQIVKDSDSSVESSAPKKAEGEDDKEDKSMTKEGDCGCGHAAKKPVEVAKDGAPANAGAPAPAPKSLTKEDVLALLKDPAVRTELIGEIKKELGVGVASTPRPTETAAPASAGAKATAKNWRDVVKGISPQDLSQGLQRALEREGKVG